MVGIVLGVPLGSSEGTPLGWLLSLGDELGISVGSFEGTLLVIAVGFSLASSEGILLGEFVGKSLGLREDGKPLGDEEAISLGISLGF